MDMERYIPALKAFGWEIVTSKPNDFAVRKGADGHYWSFQYGRLFSPHAESELRQDVTQVAPGSYAQLTLAPDYPPVVVIIFSESRLPIETDPLPSPYYGRGHTYAEAWLNALQALYEAGMAPIAEDQPRG